MPVLKEEPLQFGSINGKCIIAKVLGEFQNFNFLGIYAFTLKTCMFFLKYLKCDKSDCSALLCHLQHSCLTLKLQKVFQFSLELILPSQAYHPTLVLQNKNFVMLPIPQLALLFPSVPQIFPAFFARPDNNSCEHRRVVRRLMLHSFNPISSEFVRTILPSFVLKMTHCSFRT